MMTPKNLFKSTAWYYARYRSKYPEELIRDIVSTFTLTKKDRVLDLGSGTGQLAAQLALQSAEVVAVEPDADMIAEGKKYCTDRSAMNIRWVQARAEELNTREGVGLYKVASFGASFHWMDQERVLKYLDPHITSDGGVAIIGSPSLWTNSEPWEACVKVVIQKYLGEKRRAGDGTFERRSDAYEEILERSPFSAVEPIHFYPIRRTRTLDAVIGYLYSTSFCNPYLLGARKDAFEDELRAALLHSCPDGQFEEEEKYFALFARRK